MRKRPAVLATVAALALTIPATAAYAADGVGKSGTQLGPDEIGRSHNVEHLINLPSSGPLAGATGSDLAFQDDMAFVGNYNGFVIYDVKRPSQPRMVAQVSCPGSQNDVTVSGTLLYLSTRARTTRAPRSPSRRRRSPPGRASRSSTSRT
jgi:hypothetical protein